MVDIFNPEVSKVIKGMKGKSVLIYGANRTGKTSNLVKAPKPLVCCFENGLNAIDSIKNIKVKKWNDWTTFVRQLTSDSTIEKAKELYSTIIVDTVDGMADLAAEFICGVYGVSRINEGNRGYGLWKEYSQEINKWLKLLVNSGYTVCFIAHEGEREFSNEKGEKYTKIYPRGDKRVIDPVCDECDVIGYAQIQPLKEDGTETRSTLYLTQSINFHAGSRYPYLVRKIEEWDYEKLDRAISEAIEKEEKSSGVKAISFEQAQQVEQEREKAQKTETQKKDFLSLVNEIGESVSALGEREGNIEKYFNILEAELGTREFKVSQAPESQRAIVEQVYEAMKKAGLIH